MEFRYVGHSGFKISEITCGNWLTHGSQMENDQAKACVRAALDHQRPIGRSFPTAHQYCSFSGCCRHACLPDWFCDCQGATLTSVLARRIQRCTREVVTYADLLRLGGEVASWWARSAVQPVCLD